MGGNPSVLVKQLTPEQINAAKAYGFNYSYETTDVVYSDTMYRCGHYIEVPKGFLCDGASGGWDRLRSREWIIHDWLYATHECPRCQTEITKEEADVHMSTHRYLALKWFSGVSEEAWKSSGERGAHYMDEHHRIWHFSSDVQQIRALYMTQEELLPSGGDTPQQRGGMTPSSQRRRTMLHKNP